MKKEELKTAGVCVTYPEHDCKDPMAEHWHNQSDLTYFSCGVCGKITQLTYKSFWRRVQSLFYSTTKQS